MIIYHEILLSNSFFNQAYQTYLFILPSIMFIVDIFYADCTNYKYILYITKRKLLFILFNTKCVFNGKSIPSHRIKKFGDPCYNETHFLRLPRSRILKSFCFAAYKCHGGWKENGTMHQIISSDLPSAAGWKKLYCLAYVKWPPDRLQVSVYADNCNPNNNRTAATGSDEGLVLSFNISLSPSGKSGLCITLLYNATS